MASRRPSDRQRGRRLARVAVPDAPAPVSARAAREVTLPRARPRAALRVRAAKRRALAMAARDLADEGAPVFDHVRRDRHR